MYVVPQSTCPVTTYVVPHDTIQLVEEDIADLRVEKERRR